MIAAPFVSSGLSFRERGAIVSVATLQMIGSILAAMVSLAAAINVALKWPRVSMVLADKLFLIGAIERLGSENKLLRETLTSERNTMNWASSAAQFSRTEGEALLVRMTKMEAKMTATLTYAKDVIKHNSILESLLIAAQIIFPPAPEIPEILEVEFDD